MSFKKTLLLEFTDFQDFPGPPTIFKDFQDLENATLKLKYFPGLKLKSPSILCNFLYHLIIKESPTSGSDVYSLVWIRIFPILMSFTTDSKAGSIVSPARRIDTPHNCKETTKTVLQWKKCGVENNI